jgi:hypothetical protein
MLALWCAVTTARSSLMSISRMSRAGSDATPLRPSANHCNWHEITSPSVVVFLQQLLEIGIRLRKAIALPLGIARRCRFLVASACAPPASPARGFFGAMRRGSLSSRPGFGWWMAGGRVSLNR